MHHGICILADSDWVRNDGAPDVVGNINYPIIDRTYTAVCVNAPELKAFNEFFSSDYDSQSKNGRKLIIKGICGNCLLMVKQILLIMIKFRELNRSKLLTTHFPCLMKLRMAIILVCIPENMRAVLVPMIIPVIKLR